MIVTPTTLRVLRALLAGAIVSLMTSACYDRLEEDLPPPHVKGTAEELLTLEPRNVWKHFYDITLIPRTSGHLDGIRKHITDFGKQHGLETVVDEIGNVIIRKPATPGMEDRQCYTLQVHQDMVGQATPGYAHDFLTEPIQAYVDGDWVKAKNTTLGADDNGGICMVLALLESADIPHGPLEVLFTVDEENTMAGAEYIDKSILKGDVFLNIDSEEENVITIGCAGGVVVDATGGYTETEAAKGSAAATLTIDGLQGGHSGVDIIYGRANASKVMIGVVDELMKKYDVQLASLNGGTVDNAITRTAVALITFKPEDKNAIIKTIEETAGKLKETYSVTDNGIQLKIADAETPNAVMPGEAATKLISALADSHDGLLRCIDGLPDMVETSCNLGITNIGGGKIELKCFVRSAIDKKRDELASLLEECYQRGGLSTSLYGGFDAWQPVIDSPYLNSLKQLFQKHYNWETILHVTHGGLECSFFTEKYPAQNMASIGPEIYGAHTTEEKLYIPSVGRTYNVLLDILKAAPKK